MRTLSAPSTCCWARAHEAAPNAPWGRAPWPGMRQDVLARVAVRLCMHVCKRRGTSAMHLAST
eukprot:2703445-Alexandrium_andersonii.AAC.1